jgi:hypothetical protein
LEDRPMNGIHLSPKQLFFEFAKFSQTETRINFMGIHSFLVTFPTITKPTICAPMMHHISLRLRFYSSLIDKILDTKDIHWLFMEIFKINGSILDHFVFGTFLCGFTKFLDALSHAMWSYLLASHANRPNGEMIFPKFHSRSTKNNPKPSIKSNASHTLPVTSPNRTVKFVPEKLKHSHPPRRLWRRGG